jgi:hypothetical protein
MTAAGGEGTLGMVVWPAYIGVCTEDPGPGPAAQGEPADSSDYVRGQISWAREDSGDIVGRATVCAPAGHYTHMAYFTGPAGPCMSGKMQLSHPIRFMRAGVIDVYPITNTDLRANRRQGIDY